MDAEADVDGGSLSVPLTIKSNFNLESTLAQQKVLVQPQQRCLRLLDIRRSVLHQADGHANLAPSLWFFFDALGQSSHWCGGIPFTKRVNKNRASAIVAKEQRGEREAKKERMKRQVQFRIQKTTGKEKKKDEEFQIKLIDRIDLKRSCCPASLPHLIERGNKSSSVRCSE